MTMHSPPLDYGRVQQAILDTRLMIHETRQRRQELKAQPTSLVEMLHYLRVFGPEAFDEK